MMTVITASSYKTFTHGYPPALCHGELGGGHSSSMLLDEGGVCEATDRLGAEMIEFRFLPVPVVRLGFAE